MISIFALAALGPWSYAGFLSNPNPPDPTPAPPASTPAIPAPVGPRPKPPVPVPDAPKPPVPVPVAPKRPVVTPAAPKAPVVPRVDPAPAPAAPARYRLADAGGQAWEHADPVYLRGFVDARNRSLAPQIFWSWPPGASRCVGGRCYR